MKNIFLNKKIFLLVFITLSLNAFSQTIPVLPNIPAGDSIIFAYDVQVTLDAKSSTISNQASISGNITTFSSNDPETGTAGDATQTTIGPAMFYPKTTATDLSVVSDWSTEFTGVAGGLTTTGFNLTSQIFTVKNNVATPVVSNPWILTGGSNLVLSNPLTLNPAARLTVGTGSTADFAGNLVTLKSDATGTASIGTTTGLINNASNVTAEKFIAGGVNNSTPGSETYRRAYRYIAHPFSGSVALSQLTDNMDITGTGGSANGFTTTPTNNPSSYWYDPASGTGVDDPTRTGWKAFTHTNGLSPNTWSKGQGIIAYLRGAKTEGLTDSYDYTQSAVTLDMNGALNTGDQTISIPSTNSTAWSLVGNPFASNVDLKLLSRTNVSNSFYVWDLGMNAGKGGYLAVDLTVATPYYLPAYSSFFASYVTPGVATNIQFKETDKVSNTASSTLFRTATTNELELQLKSGHILHDVFALKATADALATKDQFDATKLYNPEVNLYSITSDSKEMAIDYRNLQTTDVVKLALYTNAKKAYSFQVSEAGLTTGMAAYLKDKFINPGQLIPLNDNSVYNFTVTNDPASMGEDRFEIVFAPLTVLPTTITKVKAYQKAAGVQVEWTTEQESNVEKYEVERSASGQLYTKLGTVAPRNNSAIVNNYDLFDATPLQGNNFYRIKSVEKNGASKYTQVVKVNIGKGDPSIAVYPKPVQGNMLTLQLNNLEKGNYDLKMFNNLGQVVFSKTINHTGGSAAQTLPVNTVRSGIYTLQLSNGNVKMNETIVFE